MKNKTAVEWLMNELTKNGSGAVRTFGDLFEQAKEMEKEQIIAAYMADTFPSCKADGEGYYNDTFK